MNENCEKSAPLVRVGGECWVDRINDRYQYAQHRRAQPAYIEAFPAQASEFQRNQDEYGPDGDEHRIQYVYSRA